MKNMTLENIAKAVHGELVVIGDHGKQMEAKGVVLDSRKVEKGFLFIATKGEKVDGHSFIDAVFDKGALGVISEKKLEQPKGSYILVKDSFQALKDMAEFYREQLDIKVVGITGSVGKTSTKECIASVLSTKYKVLKTSGNFNNEIGLPLTVLQIRQEHEIAVLEMGISDFGEMHRLSKIAKPDVCVLTNIGQCHLENLKTRDGILKAKSEIFDYMACEGSICANGDDDKLATLSVRKGSKPVFFGKNEALSVYATEITNKGLCGTEMKVHRNMEGIKDSFMVEIPLPGEHMVYNALAAVAVGTLFQLTQQEMTEGIARVEAVGGRSHIISRNQKTILDDCYNANPVSMKAAIDLLSMANTRKVAILGDMFELGERERILHQEVGYYVAYKNIDCLICIGNLAKEIYEAAKEEKKPMEIYYFKEKSDFLKETERLICKGDTILVKASHGMHFEEIVSSFDKEEA